MTKRILVFREINQEQLDALREEFHVDYLPGVSHTEDPAFVDALSRAHGLVGSSLKITSSLLDRAPNLEAIASISVGYDNYPLDELTRRGILLCNTPDVLTETTADTGFLLIMSTARRAVELAELVKQGNWKESIGKPLYGSDVHGKTRGMVGMGRLGAALARLEIRIFFEELLRRVESVEIIGTPVDQPNAFVYGLTEAHVALTPRA